MFAIVATLFGTAATLGLAAVQMIGLLLILPRLRGADREHSTSRWVGPVMGVALLLFAAASAAVFLARYGSPF